jgi:hypothetical protein
MYCVPFGLDSLELVSSFKFYGLYLVKNSFDSKVLVYKESEGPWRKGYKLAIFLFSNTYNNYKTKP